MKIAAFAISAGICLSGTILISPVLAQTTPPAPFAATASTETPAELTALRTAHQAALKSKLDAISKKQVEALRALEKKRADQGDYEGAQRILAKLEELEKASAASAPSPKQNTIVINADLHHTSAYGAVEKSGLILINKANAVVRWDSPGLPVGNYAVKMVYSAGDLEALANPQSAFVKTSPTRYRPDGTVIPSGYGGEIAIYEDTSINATNPLKVTIPLTTTVTPETTVTLGNLHISSARSALVLKALQAESEGVFNFKRLELTPVEAAPTPITSDSKDFTQLKDDYHKLLSEKIGTAQRAWLSKLDELQKSAVASENTEALAIIKTELDNLQRNATASKVPDPTAPTGTPAAPAKIVLSATDPILVTTIGEIRLSNNKETLQRLRPAKSRISFKIAQAKVPSGKFQVALNVNMGPTMGGAFRIVCGLGGISGKLETPTGPLSKEIALPDVLTIPPGASYLDLLIEDLNIPTGSLCELKSIVLTPAP